MQMTATWCDRCKKEIAEDDVGEIVLDAITGEDDDDDTTYSLSFVIVDDEGDPVNCHYCAACLIDIVRDVLAGVPTHVADDVLGEALDGPEEIEGRGKVIG